MTLSTNTIVALLLTALLLAGGPAFSMAPATFSYQGILTDATGVPLADGDYKLEFRIYQSEVGGSPLWSSSIEVRLINGVFETLLGKDDPFGIPFDRAYWLEVELENGTILTPRLELAATPYSMHASDIANGIVTGPKIADGAVLRSLNGLTDDVNLIGGTNVTIVPGIGQLTIDAVGGAGADADWTILGDDVYLQPPGAVGVGTTTPLKIGLGTRSVHVSDTWSPAFLMEQTANNGPAYSRWTWWTSNINGGLQLSYSDDPSPALDLNVLTIKPDGYVGIGTTNPRSRLSVWGSANGWDLVATEGDLRVGSDNFRLKIGVDVSLVSPDQGDVYMRAVGGSNRMLLGSGNNTVMVIDDQQVEVWDAVGMPTVRIAGALGGDTGGQIAMYQPDGTATFELDAEHGGAGGGAVAQLRSGTGVLTAEVDADVGVTGYGTFSLFSGGGTKTVSLVAQETDDAAQGAALKLTNDAGQVTIELDADYGSTNEGRVIADVIQINGGSDLSEQFGVDGEGIEPGSVVSIDPSSPGRLQISDRAYDRRVAGIVSGAGGVRPGMLMGQRGSIADGDHPVALTGRVYCRADASGGPIVPGDLLTTSSIPGYAMRVADPSLAHGAILGKAMTGLESGQGLVLVLVSLH